MRLSLGLNAILFALLLVLFAGNQIVVSDERWESCMIYSARCDLTAPERFYDTHTHTR